MTSESVLESGDLLVTMMMKVMMTVMMVMFS
jgi:hypothetical protein